MTDPLLTERLVLRRFAGSDLDVITAAMQRFEITSMLPRVPWPYTRADGLAFLNAKAAREDMTYAVTHQGALIGAVSIETQLGYWLLPEHWGKGFATEASATLLRLHFAQSDAAVPSGHRLGNDKSRNVLTKLGFTDTDCKQVFCNAEGQDVTLQNMILTAEAWVAAQ